MVSAASASKLPSGWMDGGGAVELTVDGQVATIWLDRPAKRNALTGQMWAGLERACHQLRAPGEARVALVRGRGEHFSAGAAIEELTAPSPPGQRTFMELNAAAETALDELALPTVALIDGDCIGGGCALAIDCDLRVATPRARFGITPAKLGVAYPAPSVERAIAVLGGGTVKRMVLTGELFDAQWALAHGLVDEITDDLDEAGARWAGTLGERSLVSQAAIKEMVRAAARHGSIPHEISDRWQRIAAHAGDLDEGIAAFAAKRAPRFSWTPHG